MEPAAPSAADRGRRRRRPVGLGQVQRVPRRRPRARAALPRHGRDVPRGDVGGAARRRRPTDDPTAVATAARGAVLELVDRPGRVVDPGRRRRRVPCDPRAGGHLGVSRRRGRAAATRAAPRRPAARRRRGCARRPAQGIVVEGRDIGSVVLPDADLKVWLVADPAVRAARRAAEDAAAGRRPPAADLRRGGASRPTSPAATPPTPARAASPTTAGRRRRRRRRDRPRPRRGDRRRRRAGPRPGDGMSARPAGAVHVRRGDGAQPRRAGRCVPGGCARPPRTSCPLDGPVVLAAQHTAFLDGLLLLATSPRPGARARRSARTCRRRSAGCSTPRRQIRTTSTRPTAARCTRRRPCSTPAVSSASSLRRHRGAGDAAARPPRARPTSRARTGATVVPVAILGARPAGGRARRPAAAACAYRRRVRRADRHPRRGRPGSTGGARQVGGAPAPGAGRPCSSPRARAPGRTCPAPSPNPRPPEPPVTSDDPTVGPVTGDPAGIDPSLLDDELGYDDDTSPGTPTR